MPASRCWISYNIRALDRGRTGKNTFMTAKAQNSLSFSIYARKNTEYAHFFKSGRTFTPSGRTCTPMCRILIIHILAIILNLSHLTFMKHCMK